MRAHFIGIIISSLKEVFQLIYFYKKFFIMWTIIKDCGKQLTIHSKLREKVDADYKVYDLSEIEFDQYHLELVSLGDVVSTEKQHIVLTCDQLRKYHFEVEETKTPAV
jgi:hypothetical protein